MRIPTNYILEFRELRSVTNQRTKTKVSGLLFFIPIFFMIFSLSFINSNHVFAAEKFLVILKETAQTNNVTALNDFQ